MIMDVLSVGTKLIDKLIPDPQAKLDAHKKLTEMAMNGDLKTIQQQSENIRTEMKGDSWLQRNWRPVTMLTFTGLIVAHWMGWTAPNLTENEIVGLLDIVKIGLAGYVVGRSGEKMMKEYKK